METKSIKLLAERLDLLAHAGLRALVPDAAPPALTLALLFLAPVVGLLVDTVVIAHAASLCALLLHDRGAALTLLCLLLALFRSPPVLAAVLRRDGDGEGLGGGVGVRKVGHVPRRQRRVRAGTRRQARRREAHRDRRMRRGGVLQRLRL